VEGRSLGSEALVVNLGLRSDSFGQVLHHNLFTMVAQYYGIVQDGMLSAIHAFSGLKRPLMHGDDKDADKSVVVYSWRPAVDFVWTGSRLDGHPIEKTPPPGRVFVVLVREEKQPNRYEGVGDIWGSIERWNWVKEDPVLPQAPVDWKDRYGRKLWSRE
jgi:hypothetical protein